MVYVFTYFPDERGLEVRRHGARQAVPMGVHNGVRGRHVGDHPGGARPPRHDHSHRLSTHQDNQTTTWNHNQHVITQTNLTYLQYLIEFDNKGYMFNLFCLGNANDVT